MIFFVTLFLVISPIGSIPFSIFASVKDSKRRFIYLIELAIGLAFLAYCWVPDEIFDLYVWQKQAASLSRMSLNEFYNYIISNSEPISLFIKYIIGKNGNLSLLQFCVVVMGYINIFYILYDSCKSLQIKKISYLLTLIYIMISLMYLNFISGLFFTWAITLLATGIYIYYSKNKKIIPIILMIVSILIHTAIIFPIMVFIMFLAVKSKINYKSFLIILIIGMAPKYILPLLAQYTNIALFNELYIMYQGYFVLDVYNKMNAGGLLIINILTSVPIYVIYITARKKVEKLGKLAIIINIVSWLLYLTAPIFIRYIYLSILLFMTSFEKYFDVESKSNIQKNNRKIIFYILSFIEIIVCCYQLYLLKDINIINIILDNIYKPILQIFFT